MDISQLHIQIAPLEPCAVIRIPCFAYKQLVERFRHIKYRQWIGISYGGFEYYGRPLPCLATSLTVPDLVKMPCGTPDSSVKFLDKLPSLASITLDAEFKGRISCPVGIGCFIRSENGELARVVDTEPSCVLGLVTFTTTFKTVEQLRALPSPPAPLGSLEKAFADLIEHFGTKNRAVLCGVKGVGKAWTAERVAAFLDVPFEFLPSGDFFHTDFNPNGKALYFIADADELCPSRELFPNKIQDLAKFYSRLYDLSSFTNSLFVLGFRDPKGIDSQLTLDWADGRIDIKFPDALERRYILDHILDIKSVDRDEIVQRSAGYVHSDLCKLVTVIRGKLLLSPENFNLEDVISEFSSSVHSQFKLDVDRTVTWSTLGGLSRIRKRIQEIIEDPLKYATEYKMNRINPPRGLLLFGPPGCSKTSIAKAIANSTGLPFYSLDTAAVFSCYVGESERLIRELFAAARLTKPSIIFFDEIEVIVGKRGEDNCDALQQRLLATFLTEMDGVENADGVLVIGATNRPEKIDPALLRPGRFDHIIEIGLPDIDDRMDILSKLTQSIGLECADVNRKVAGLTEGYSAADLKDLVSRAALECRGGPLTVDLFREQISRGSRIESSFPLYNNIPQME